MARPRKKLGIALSCAINAGDNYRIAYDSIFSAARDVATPVAQNAFNLRKINESFGTKYNSAFWDDLKPETLMDRIRQPHQSSIDTVRQYRDMLADDLFLPELRRHRVRAENGPELNSDRFLDRRLDCFDAFAPRKTRRRVVRIGINISIAYYRTAPELLHRGAAVIALADYLHLLDYSVGIDVFGACKNPTSTVPINVYRVTLKEPDSPLILSSLVSACCDIGVARLLLIVGVARLLPGHVAKSFGSVLALPDEDAKAYDFLAELDIVTQSGAAHWLKACAEKMSRVTDSPGGT